MNSMDKKLFITISLLLSLCSCSNNVSTSSINDSSSNIDYSKFTRVIACSDYQAENGHNKSQENVWDIMAQMENDGIEYADAFFCCGDYDYNYTDSINGIKSLQETMSYYVEEENMIFVQGNHDNVLPGMDNIAKTGDNSPESNEYGVFVINEDDYMWYNNSEVRVKTLALQLQNYINSKLEENYTRPIFILSHLALNYSMRTFEDGDGVYAKYIFDILNEAGAKGLNIIFMYGHNHSNGWDDYLGGASVFLNKGDLILISDYSKKDFSEHKLNFTYMTAGYVGYYRDVNEGADTTLSMTVMDIYYDKVIFNRYSKDGKSDLKACGVRNEYKEESAYNPNETVYPSPQTSQISKIVESTPINIFKK